MPRLDAGRVATWRAFGVVAAEMHRKVEAGLMEDYDLPLAWFEILAALQAAGGAMRVGELCEVLHELPSSLSRRLDRLEAEGFVSRAATPTVDDRRSVTVSLTRDGRAEWRDANITYRRMVQQHFANVLSDTDVAALQRIFGKLGV
ncbi:MAG TPA: MarR family transcriptional regulator [Ilumatobacteraceae bacterium]|jgi:DNA-binding MarR family transcriptional regulator|nr:MarR family transcriptional regulator [Ilumatobacteraceae bacterium]